MKKLKALMSRVFRALFKEVPCTPLTPEIREAIFRKEEAAREAWEEIKRLYMIR